MGGASLSLGPLQRRPPVPPPPAGKPRAGACRGCAAAGVASCFYSPPPQTGRQPLGVGRSEGAAGSGRGGRDPGGGVWRTPSPGWPRRFHLRGLGGPPRGLIRRGCAWRTLNIWIPARPLPRPAPPGLRRGDPAARASRLRFSRKRGNPASNLPRVRACALGNSHWLRPMLSPISQVGNLGSRTPQQS